MFIRVQRLKHSLVDIKKKGALNIEQKQPFKDVPQKRCSSKFRKIQWKTPVLESLLNKLISFYQLKRKRDFNTDVLL